VLDDEGGAVPDGSGRAGLIAVTGYLPDGYHNDPEKTAATFREHQGTRYSVPGDYATIDADRTLHLLGRGAAVINTGGEKVFAEEVEEALKSHDAVRDAVVVGVPDELLGERVVAVVSGGAGDEQALIAHVRSRLAGYKTPKAVVFAERIVRGPSGKVDLAWARATAALRNEGG
jgi:acyl-CoA synthetase (AMP-forming)/AMP-acid ligase II